MKAFKLMPLSIRASFLAFLAVPFLALAFATLNKAAIDGLAPTEAFGFQFGFFVLPPVFCLLILMRSIWAVALFAAQTVLILTINMIMLLLQFQFAALFGVVALLATMAVGMVLLDKDLYAPLLSKSPRLWRTQRRHYANVTASLVPKASDARYPAVLQDSSLTGMGLIASREDFLKNGAFVLKKGDVVDVEVKIGGRPQVVNTEVQWIMDMDEFVAIGVAAADRSTMARFIEAMPANPSKLKAVDKLERLIAAGHFQRAMVAMWAVGILSSSVLTMQALSKIPADELISSVDVAP